MEKVCFFLFVLFLSIKVNSQNEYVYSNADYGVEVTFPSEPEVAGTKAKYLDFFSASLSLFSNSLSYSIAIERSPFESDKITAYSNEGYDIINKSEYNLGKKNVKEYDFHYGAKYLRCKIISFKKITVELKVYSSSCPRDKDVFPFFNSLKIDGISILNPSADNNIFKEYALEDIYKNKPDTVKQIVYVNSNSKNNYQFEKLSDVDKNIPQNELTNPYRFALIIGNEDYRSHQADLKSESNVEFARNDASAFREYCINMLRIPEKNITFLLDATVGQINQGITKLKLLSKVCNGKSQLIVFYAGHGLPDENSKEPYLIPVDISGANITSGIKLQDLYKNLTEFPSERIMVFLDACFTGGGRNAGLIASRGVKIKPKEDVLSGNIVVFSSSSGEQSSLPYSEKKHGMFSYFLLKKLQETKGELTYSDLFEFLNEKISIESLLVNSKEQNPVVNTSQDIAGTWKLWKVK
jgi:hypothetical protein